jgi:hypothetical protein
MIERQSSYADIPDLADFGRSILEYRNYVILYQEPSILSPLSFHHISSTNYSVPNQENPACPPVCFSEQTRILPTDELVLWYRDVRPLRGRFWGIAAEGGALPVRFHG